MSILINKLRLRIIEIVSIKGRSKSILNANTLLYFVMIDLYLVTSKSIKIKLDLSLNRSTNLSTLKFSIYYNNIYR